MSSLADQLHRKISGWRKAEEEANGARAERRLSAAECLAAAEELRALNPGAFEGPDAVREREVAEVRRAWAQLRSQWHRSNQG